MRYRSLLILLATLFFFIPSLPGRACQNGRFKLEVLVNGVPRPEYSGHGRVYVEALKGKEYALRITNPLSRRVAVALSVDGLNTIDASRTTAAAARKWVIDPHGSIVISGWQVTGKKARAFFFTDETHSFGAWLGKTQNLGVVEAVFYAEKRWGPIPLAQECPSAGGVPRAQSDSSSRMKRAPSAESKSAEALGLSDQYAATGIGRERRHPVRQVYMNLEDHPAASISIRYEFRPQLMAMGLIPKPHTKPCPMQRRRRATGFDKSYCPDPFAR